MAQEQASRTTTPARTRGFRAGLRRRGTALATSFVVAVAALAAAPAPVSAEEGDPGGPGIVQPKCSDAAHLTWHYVNDVVADLWPYLVPIGTPAFGPVFAELGGVVSSVSTYARLSRCWDSQQVATLPTVEAMIEAIEEMTEERIAASLRDAMAAHAYALSSMLAQQEPLLKAFDAGELTGEDRRSLSITLAAIGDKATLALNAALDHASWLSMPLIPPLGVVAMAAYSAAGRTALPGEYRQRMLAEQVQARRTAIRNGVRAKEAQLRAVLAASTEEDRDQAWRAVMPGYLATKAALGLNLSFAGEAEHAFFLVNGDSGGCAGGAPVVVSGCAGSASAPAGAQQVWSYVPRTALLRQVGSGGCLRGPDGLGGGTQVVSVADCPAKPAANGEYTGFEWGLHPSGNLVHLASRSCLGQQAGTEVRAVDCSTDPGDTRQRWRVRPAVAALRVDVAGDPGARARSVPEGLDCGSTASGPASCEANFEVGSPVLLGAVRSSTGESSRVQWRSGCTTSDSGVCLATVGLDGAAVSVDTSPLGSVVLGESAAATANVAPGPTTSPECLPDDTGARACTWWFPRGTEVAIDAIADPGFVFARWSGACAGQGPRCRLTVDEAGLAAAPEVVAAGVLRVSKSGSGNGSVQAVAAEPAAGAIDCGSVCVAQAPLGSLVELEAVPAVGDTFAGWGGACSGARCVVQVGGLTSVSARFEPQTPPPAAEVKVAARVVVVPARRAVRAGSVLRLRLRVDAYGLPSGVRPSGTVQVQAAGKRRTLRLPAGAVGAAVVVKLRVGKRVAPGRTVVRAVYSGDHRVLAGRGSAWVRVVRR